MMDNINQRTQVLDYMMKNGRISPRQADRELGIMRLGARIWELKKLGFHIDDEFVSYENAQGVKKRYKEYWLVDA